MIKEGGKIVEWYVYSNMTWLQDQWHLIMIQTLRILHPSNIFLFS